MTLREALGGPWATHWALWAGLFVPASLLVVLRESVTGFDTWWWPLVSAVLQHLAVGLIILGGGALARRRREVLSLSTVAALWAAAALVRALIGGALAAAIAGADPEFVARTLVWLLGSVVWVPLVVYTAAQLDRRRLLLGTLDAMTASIEQQRVHADETGDQVRRSLNAAVRDSLQPALGELVASLETSRERLSVQALAELSLRVSQLHDRTADLLEPKHDDLEHLPPVRSSLRRAFDVAPRLPWVVAGLTALSTTAVLLPDVWRVFGLLAAIELTISIAAASAFIGLIPWLVGRLAPQSLWLRDQRATVVSCSLGIALAVYLMLNSGIDPITQNGLTVVPLLVVALFLSYVVLVGAIVLADANLEASAEVAQRRLQRDREREAHDAVVSRERLRLTDLMHGPVQGRLAACVMALTFSAAAAPAGDGGPTQVDAILVDSVLDHLRAVSRDLSSIASIDSPASP
jgi:hypothetical protein